MLLPPLITIQNYGRRDAALGVSLTAAIYHVPWQKRCLINYVLLITLTPHTKAALRFQKILYVASEFLCNCDPPVLKRVPLGGGDTAQANGQKQNWNWAEDACEPPPRTRPVIHEYISVVQGRVEEEVSVGRLLLGSMCVGQKQ